MNVLNSNIAFDMFKVQMRKIASVHCAAYDEHDDNSISITFGLFNLGRFYNGNESEEFNMMITTLDNLCDLDDVRIIYPKAQLVKVKSVENFDFVGLDISAYTDQKTVLNLWEDFSFQDIKKTIECLKQAA